MNKIPKGTVKGITKIFLVVSVFFTMLLVADMIFAVEQLSVKTSKEKYQPNENIFITVYTGSRNLFNISILGPSSNKVYFSTDYSDLRGQYFILLRNLSSTGTYIIDLESRGNKTTGCFTIGETNGLNESSCRTVNNISTENQENVTGENQNTSCDTCKARENIQVGFWRILMPFLYKEEKQ